MVVSLSSRFIASAVLLAALLVAGPAAGQPAEEAFAALGVHQPAEPFPAPDPGFVGLDGRPRLLRDLQGRAVLLGFFTTW